MHKIWHFVLSVFCAKKDINYSAFLGQFRGIFSFYILGEMPVPDFVFLEILFAVGAKN